MRLAQSEINRLLNDRLLLIRNNAIRWTASRPSPPSPVSSRRAASRARRSVSASRCPSVSRQVADLEAHLDARLLNRTTRRLSLTESGQAFFERCVQLLADLEEAEVAVTSASIVPRGTLRLTCSATFGARHLAPAIAAFVARHRADALRRRALRARRRSGGRRLRSRRARRRHRQPEPRRAAGSARRASSAAPRRRTSSVTASRATPEDLATHACLTYEYLPNRNVWSFRDPRRLRAQRADHRPGSREQRSLQRGARGRGGGHRARARLHRRPGRARRPAEADPARLRAAAAATSTSSIPSRRHLSAKVRAFADFLVERFATENWGVE